MCLLFNKSWVIKCIVTGDSKRLSTVVYDNYKHLSALCLLFSAQPKK